jgi:hypothetical protein
VSALPDYELACHDSGSVASGKRCWQDGKAVAGQRFEYAFDDIGNRKTVCLGGKHEYIPNSGTQPTMFTKARLRTR